MARGAVYADMWNQQLQATLSSEEGLDNNGTDKNAMGDNG